MLGMRVCVSKICYCCFVPFHLIENVFFVEHCSCIVAPMDEKKNNDKKKMKQRNGFNRCLQIGAKDKAFETYNKKENMIVKASRYLLFVEPHDIVL